MGQTWICHYKAEFSKKKSMESNDTDSTVKKKSQVQFGFFI